MNVHQLIFHKHSRIINPLLTEFARDRTGRISALGLSCTDLAALGPYCQDLGPIFSQYGPRTRSIRCIYYFSIIIIIIYFCGGGGELGFFCFVFLLLKRCEFQQRGGNVFSKRQWCTYKTSTYIVLIALYAFCSIDILAVMVQVVMDMSWPSVWRKSPVRASLPLGQQNCCRLWPDMFFRQVLSTFFLFD